MNNLYALANGLGFTFVNTEPDQQLPPERFLIELCKLEGKLLSRHSRPYSLTRTWVKMHAKYIRAELLQRWSTELSLNGLRFLGSLCAIARDNDTSTRWNRVISGIKEQIGSSNCPTNSRDSYLSEFGIDSWVIAHQPERKFSTLEHVLNINPWIRYRTIMGTTARADVFAAMEIFSASEITQQLPKLGIKKSLLYLLREEANRVSRAIQSTFQRD